MLFSIFFLKITFLIHTHHITKKSNFLFSQYLHICRCICIHKKRKRWKIAFIFCIQIQLLEYWKWKLNTNAKIKPFFCGGTHYKLKKKRVLFLANQTGFAISHLIYIWFSQSTAHLKGIEKYIRQFYFSIRLG